MTAKLPAPPYPASVTVKRAGREVEVPIVPEDIDVRAFGRMPVDINRLLTSDFYIGAEPLAFKLGFTLWCRSWQQVPAGSLPDDERKLCHLSGLGADLRTWRRLSKTALHGFEKCSDGRLYHVFVCEVALGAFKQLRRNSEGGRSTARKRQDADNTENGDRLGNVDTGGVGGAPETNGHERPGTRLSGSIEGKGREDVAKATCSDEFETWWKDYPRRVGKGQARKAFKTACGKVASLEVLLAGARAYAAQTAGSEARFVKHPATWLNGEGWLDEPPAPAQGVPKLNGKADGADMAAIDRMQWWGRVEGFAKDQFWMAEEWGPMPGSAGCRAPPDVLAEFGYGGLALGVTSKPAA